MVGAWGCDGTGGGWSGAFLATQTKGHPKVALVVSDADDDTRLSASPANGPHGPDQPGAEQEQRSRLRHSRDEHESLRATTMREGNLVELGIAEQGCGGHPATDSKRAASRGHDGIQSVRIEGDRQSRPQGIGAGVRPRTVESPSAQVTEDERPGKRGHLIGQRWRLEELDVQWIENEVRRDKRSRERRSEELKEIAELPAVAPLFPGGGSYPQLPTT